LFTKFENHVEIIKKIFAINLVTFLALKLIQQASLNLSLNSQIKVESVKNTIFEVILPHRKGLNAIGAIKKTD
jgi:hypothetical protein